jgi:hypothetical protein
LNILQLNSTLAALRNSQARLHTTRSELRILADAQRTRAPTVVGQDSVQEQAEAKPKGFFRAVTKTVFG